jgi:uncharacterized protein
MINTIFLLILSNVIMTFAWYAHLKQSDVPLWKAIVVSWLIAFLEYCFMIPANRIGFANGLNPYQLKMTQEVITLIIFVAFATFYLKEPFHWKYIVSFLLLIGSVFFAFKKF